MMPSWLFQVGSKTDCYMCIGPMEPDGYGVCYNPMDDHINVAVTAFNSCEETNASKLTRFLKEALLDMKALLEKTAKPCEWDCFTGGMKQMQAKRTRVNTCESGREKKTEKGRRHIFLYLRISSGRTWTCRRRQFYGPYFFASPWLLFLPQHFNKDLWCGWKKSTFMLQYVHGTSVFLLAAVYLLLFTDMYEGLLYSIPNLGFLLYWST